MRKLSSGNSYVEWSSGHRGPRVNYKGGGRNDGNQQGTLRSTGCRRLARRKGSVATATVKLAEDSASKGDLAILRSDLGPEINGLRGEIYKVMVARTLLLVAAMVGLELFG